MSEFKCDCGGNAGHTDYRMCEANRRATADMQSRQNFPPSTPCVRDEAGKFVRLPVGEEYHLPHGTAVRDGVIRRY